ncbi:hypothetical protein JCM8547_002813 [Rhodosporidiobolus lusitaniae]
MSVRSTQTYNAVGADDLSDLDEAAHLHALRPLPTAELSTVHGLQQALDAHPPPPRVSPALKWLVRAFPILGTLSWLATLLTLLLIWIIRDHRILYKWYLGAMPYLSDVGADNKTVFLFGNIATAVFFTMSLWQERLLRAKRVMVEATEERHLWVAVGVMDVLIGGLGGIALVLLAIFDAFNYPREHNAFMTSFIICVTLSGLLQTVEVEHLWHEHPDRHDLRDGTILKWITLLFSAACGIAFWVLYYVCDGDATKDPYPRCYRITTASAILEWAACFGCAAYLSTLILDVWPPHRLSPPTPIAWADRTGLRGVWIVQPSTGERTAVHLPEGLAVHRPPVHRGEMREGTRCAVVLRPGAGVGPATTTSKGGGDGVDGVDFAWYSEGKRVGRKSRKNGGGER